MAVGIRMLLAGVTVEEYDAVNALIDPASDPPVGLIFHASGPVEGGWGVVDVWQSREAFDAFAPRIQQAVTTAGVEMHGPPAIEEFAVHETFPA